MLVVTEIVTACLSRGREDDHGKSKGESPVMLRVNQQFRQIKGSWVFWHNLRTQVIYKWNLKKGGESLVRGRRFCSVSSSHICTRMSRHVFRNREYFVPLGHCFAGCWSSMISLSISRVVGMANTKNLNY